MLKLKSSIETGPGSLSAGAWSEAMAVLLLTFPDKEAIHRRDKDTLTWSILSVVTQINVA